MTRNSARVSGIDQRFNHWTAVRNGLMNAHADVFLQVPAILKAVPDPIDQMKIFELIQIVPSPTRSALRSGDLAGYRVSDPKIMAIPAQQQHVHVRPGRSRQNVSQLSRDPRRDVAVQRKIRARAGDVRADRGAGEKVSDRSPDAAQRNPGFSLVGWVSAHKGVHAVFDGLWARNPPADGAAHFEHAATPDGGLRRFAPNPPYEALISAPEAFASWIAFQTLNGVAGIGDMADAVDR